MPMWFRFPGDIHMCKNLRVITDTAESNMFYEKVFSSNLKKQFRNIFYTVLARTRKKIYRFPDPHYWPRHDTPAPPPRK